MLPQVAVDEAHVLLHPQAPAARQQRVAVALPPQLAHLGVGLADHQVQQVRVAPDQRRQRREHVLDPLALVEQAKGGEHPPPPQPRARLAPSSAGGVRPPPTTGTPWGIWTTFPSAAASRP